MIKQCLQTLMDNNISKTYNGPKFTYNIITRCTHGVVNSRSTESISNSMSFNIIFFHLLTNALAQR